MKFEVVGYGPFLEAAHARLFPEREAGDLAWKLADGGLAAIAIENDVVGINAFRAVRLKCGAARSLPGYQSLDTVVAPEARGKGVFTKLVKAFYAHDHGGELLYGFPNENSSKGFFTHLDWRPLGTPPFLVKPLRSGYFARRLLPALSPLDVPLSVTRPGKDTPVERFEADANVLWARFSAQIGCAVERDAAYLNHRIFGRPEAGYETFARYSDGLSGFVTTRVADKHGGRIGYVMEALGSDLRGLISGAVGRMRQAGAEVALAWCAPWSPNYRDYRATGFVPLPEGLRPIRLRVGARALGSPQAGMRPQDWYFSYLDSDTV